MGLTLESLIHSSRLNEIVQDASFELNNHMLQGWELTRALDPTMLAQKGIRVHGMSEAKNYLVIGNGSYDVEINFNGFHDNVIVLGDYPNGLTSRLDLEGGANKVTLCGSSRQRSFARIVCHGDKAAFHLGRDTRTLDLLAAVEGGTKITIGRNCLIASRVQVRTTDSHAIFDLNTGERINLPKNILIGADVWLAEDCLILKGTTIGEGSVIGARSVISGNSIDKCSLAAGNPIRMLRKNIAWSFELFPNAEVLEDRLQDFRKYDS